MEVEERISFYTKGILDPAKRERKIKIFRRILSYVEPQEFKIEDNGRCDGILPRSAKDYEDELKGNSKEYLQSIKDNISEDGTGNCENDEDKDTEVEEINKQGKFGYTKLHIAVIEENYEEIRKLLEAGIDAKIIDRSKATAYFKAKNFNDLEAIAIFHEFEIFE